MALGMPDPDGAASRPVVLPSPIVNPAIAAEEIPWMGSVAARATRPVDATG
jgi:hypothetical protein